MDLTSTQIDNLKLALTIPFGFGLLGLMVIGVFLSLGANSGGNAGKWRIAVDKILVVSGYSIVIWFSRELYGDATFALTTGRLLMALVLLWSLIYIISVMFSLLSSARPLPLALSWVKGIAKLYLEMFASDIRILARFKPARNLTTSTPSEYWACAPGNRFGLDIPFYHYEYFLNDQRGIRVFFKKESNDNLGGLLSQGKVETFLRDNTSALEALGFKHFHLVEVE